LIKGLIHINVISTFHIIVIIYQRFNVKAFRKSWNANQFKTFFFLFFIKILQTLCLAYHKLNGQLHGPIFKLKDVLNMFFVFIPCNYDCHLENSFLHILPFYAFMCCACNNIDTLPLMEDSLSLERLSFIFTTKYNFVKKNYYFFIM
jgi:hypothetical protein